MREAPENAADAGDAAVQHGEERRGAADDLASGAATRPATKAIRQETSPACGRARPPRMPLTPAMRPFSTAKSAAAPPMIAPPITADAGGNAFQSIDMGGCRA